MTRFRKGKKAYRKFDGFEWRLGTSGKQRLLASHYNRMKCDQEYQALIDNIDNHWMCGCGNYQEDGLHCSACGNEPPWGCDCSFCNDKRYGEEQMEDFSAGDFWGMADGL